MENDGTPSSPDTRITAKGLRTTIDANRAVIRGVASSFAAGLIVLAFGDLSANLVAEAPKVLNALFVTCVIVAGAALGQSWAALEQSSRWLGLAANVSEETLLPSRDSARERVERKEVEPIDKAAIEYYRFKAWRPWAFGLSLASAGLYLTAIWMAALTSFCI